MQKNNIVYYFLLTLFVVSLLFSVPKTIYAKIGVGVATGKIIVDQILHPGSIYQIPALTVVNTGDEAGDYAVGISYLEKQEELKPAISWFKFEPEKFRLEPGKMQSVKITINVPIKVVPGKYFAYLEGHPLQATDNGQTSVGIAAAAKLYFEVAPANLLIGLYYRVITFWKLHHPLDTIIAGIIVFISLLMTLKSQFNFQITKKSSKSAKENDE